MAEGAPIKDERARPFAPIVAPRLDESAERVGLTGAQIFVLAVMLAATALALWLRPTATCLIIILLAQLGFMALALWRVALVLTPTTPVPVQAPESLPRYSILVALHREAEVAPQLISRLSAIDYPADRLQALLLLEAHDHDTIAAVRATSRPPWLQLLIVPPGLPQTKPRALNWGLAHADGDLVVVYDAEDEPDPGQLREAAARFDADDSGRLACLQAPLRIRTRRRVVYTPSFLERQFAAEYASLFDLVLPAMARMGLPFPLGGTSNHFRADTLRQVGGWDAWNVTEDADLGFRLWRHGWRLGVLDLPTLETSPERLEVWLPQRTRWLKGYMQTLLVHMRHPLALGPRGIFAVMVTLVAAIAASATHAPSIAWVIAGIGAALSGGMAPDLSVHALAIMFAGMASAWLTCFVGARRSGLKYGARDMLSAPVYWSLTSLALAHAVWRLIWEPHVWDKTPHRPDERVDTGRKSA